MLQQTRVEAVRPYYARFLKALPTVADLRSAPDDLLYKLWEGLGYYSRARNLRRAAQVIVEEYGGELPQSLEKLQKLPGIGPYTAGAIASIAFHIPAAAVDGNVLRVLARLNASEANISLPAVKRAAEQAVVELMQDCSPGMFNQALMELGAVICLPNATPLCVQCPLGELCKARAKGNQKSLPVRDKKAPRRVEEKTVFVLKNENSFLVRKRESTGLLAGLWELPNSEGMTDTRGMTNALASFGLYTVGEVACYGRKHVFTHVEWHMRVYALHVAGEVPAGWEWAKQQDDAHALPTAFRICL